MLVGSYNGWLVLVSLLVAILASYTALDMAARIEADADAAGRWLAGGAFAMGVGIWSMHFVGMLAFRLPIPIGYDPAITFASLLIAIASSAFALWLVRREELTAPRLAYGALLMGTGVAAMHYTGMAAMRLRPGIEYAPGLFALSVAIAVAASGAALWIAFRLRRDTPGVRRRRAGAAVVMGIAIGGMHYTGMAAARFPIGSVCGAAGAGISVNWLALLIVIATVSVLALALTISLLDARIASRTATLTHSLADANLEIARLALHDKLTQLPNRVLLEERLEHAVRRAAAARRRFAVMVVDLDGFKGINDAFGHLVGDLLLVEASARLRAGLHTDDTLARTGGDEFVLVAGTGEPAEAAACAAALVEAIRRPFTIAGHSLRLTASLGIALYAGAPQPAGELLRNADAAMYHAKAQGRDNYCFFEASMNANAQEELLLLHDLRAALERREVVLHYQPKFDAASHRMVGAEALLRWQHPVRGLIPPGEFIGLAEDTGLIVSIGAWVLDEACRQLAAWHRAGHPDWSVAVNLSPLQFGHPGLAGLVRAALERHELAPDTVILEVTESSAMREGGLAILHELGALGVKISIDDFGTGYSSLLYLKQLPATELKIDGSFVHDFAQDTGDAAILSVIVTLGRTLNLAIVAEGVETAAQQEFLTRLGCTTLQGFLLGRPVPPELLLESAAEPLPAAALARPGGDALQAAHVGLERGGH